MCHCALGLPSGSEIKNLPAMQVMQETTLIPGSEPPGGGYGNPLENSMDRGATANHAIMRVRHDCSD